MSEHTPITGSGVPASPTKRTSVSGIRSTPGESIDRRAIDKDIYTACERIRKAIVTDKSLSLYAQNIKISAGPSGVTLNGTVKSQQEKDKVETGAAMVIDVDQVHNELVVRSSNNSGQAMATQSKESSAEPDSELEYSRIRRLWGIRENRL